MTKSLGRRTRWKDDELALVETIITNHKLAGETVVPWKRMLDKFPGHTLGALYQMANIIRERMTTKKRAEYRRMVQSLLDGIMPEGVPEGTRVTMGGVIVKPRRPLPIAPEATPPSPKTVLGLDAERRNTSTQKLAFAAEMMARIGAQGVTAGLLGDPPPGCSALDEKRGIPDPRQVGVSRRMSDKRKPRQPHSDVRRQPTLPTRPMQF